MIVDFKLSSADFVKRFQEKKPLLIKEAINPCQGLWADFNGIFERNNIQSEDFKLLHGRIVPKHEYVEIFSDVGTLRYRLIKPVVYDYLRNGATLIANKIVNEPRVNELSRQIARFTGRQTVASAYAAFGDRILSGCIGILATYS